jgi:hypothetical protein
MSGVCAAWGAPGEGPSGVSPGGLEEVLTAPESCPTFSWAASAGDGFELAVFEIEPGVLPGEATRGGDVLEVQLPGGAHSWTPSVGRCLEPGEFYGWSIRAVVDGVPTERSAARLFRISERPSPAEVLRAQEILESHLAESSARQVETAALSGGVGAGAATEPAGQPGGPVSEALGVTTTVDIEGTVEARGVRSLSDGVSTQGSIVADGEISTREGDMETVALYLTAPGTLDRQTLIWSPSLNEVEIKRPFSSEPDGELLINRVFAEGLEVGMSDTVQAGLVSIGSTAASYQGDGGTGVDYVPLNGDDEMRLDTAGDICATGFVTAVRFKVVDTNQAGVEVKCSN